MYHYKYERISIENRRYPIAIEDSLYNFYYSWFVRKLSGPHTDAMIEHDWSLQWNIVILRWLEHWQWSVFVCFNWKRNQLMTILIVFHRSVKRFAKIKRHKYAKLCMAHMKICPRYKTSIKSKTIVVLK